jgi:hypothetical protein
MYNPANTTGVEYISSNDRIDSKMGCLAFIFLNLRDTTLDSDNHFCRWLRLKYYNFMQILEGAENKNNCSTFFSAVLAPIRKGAVKSLVPYTDILLPI